MFVYVSAFILCVAHMQVGIYKIRLISGLSPTYNKDTYDGETIIHRAIIFFLSARNELFDIQRLISPSLFDFSLFLFLFLPLSLLHWRYEFFSTLGVHANSFG